MLLELTLLLGIVAIICAIWSLKRPNNFPPGPIGMPILGSIPFLGAKSYEQFGKLGKQYGDIYSIKMGSYWFVVLNDFEVIKAAMKLDTFSGRPNYLLRMSFYKKGIIFSEGHHWKEQRNFSTKVLRDLGFGKVSMVTSIQEEVKELVEFVRSTNEKAYAPATVLPIAIINSLWHILTGEKFLLADPFPQKICAAIKGKLSMQDVKSPISLLSWYSTLFPNSDAIKRMRSGVDDLNQLLKPVLQKHYDEFIEGARPRDFIDVYLQHIAKVEDPDSSFYKGEGELNLRDTLMNFFLAGSNTLRNTLGFVILYLAKSRGSLKKVHEEIDRVIGQKRVPDPSDSAKMPFTEAVMLETLRLSSIVPGNVLHSTTEDVTFMGYSLPKGTIIMPNLYQVHHDEKYWGDPEEFKPERFLNPDGSFRNDERVLAFGIGKRICMGESLARLEYFLFLTGILQAFDLIEDPAHPLPSFEPHVGFQLSPQPYQIIFRKRN